MFKYINLNPNQLEENDCVCRAISLASGCDYEDIQDKLYYVSKLLDCDELCPCCYRFLIENVFEFQPEYCHGLTVGEFAQEHPYGVYLVRIPEHLTTIVDGAINDIWDSSEFLCDLAWRCF